MKKFIYLLNILLLLLIPTTLYMAVEDDTISYRTNVVSNTKMINTTVLLDRSNEKKKLREEEEKKRLEEEAKVMRLAEEKEKEQRKNEALIKAKAVKSTNVVKEVQVVEQVSSLESSGNSNHEDNTSSSDDTTSSKDSNVGTTTTVTVGSNEKAYVGYKFSGNMSAYGRDCCSSNPANWGLTASGFNIYTNGMYYNDNEYGRVRIIAASRDDFYLYSVIKVTDPIDGEYRAIVLDRGDKNIGIGRKFVFDLVVESQEWARMNYGVHRNVNFEVLRIGK